VACPITSNPYGDHESREGLLVSHAINAKGGSGRMDFESETFVAHTLRADGFDAGEDGTGRGTPLVPATYPCLRSNQYNNSDPGMEASMLVAFQQKGEIHDHQSRRSQNARKRLPISVGFDKSTKNKEDSQADSRTGQATHTPSCERDNRGAGESAVAFTQNQCGDVLTGNIMHSLTTNANATGRGSANVHTGTAVRRLTARECERLQGFPDDYTLVQYRGKSAADGPRYRALGNSMAIPVIAWIAKRIDDRE